MLEANIAGKKLQLNSPETLLSKSSQEDIQNIVSLIPEMTQEQFVHWVIKMHENRSLLTWKLSLKNVKLRKEYNKEKIESIVDMWNQIINEYFDYQYIKYHGILIPRTQVHNFNISILYHYLKMRDNEKHELAYRLIDVKMYFSFYYSIMFIEYDEPILIVGNNDLDKLSPTAINWIKGLTFRISHLSILIEKTFDMIEFVHNGNVSDHKKGKWEKKIGIVSSLINISEEEKRQIIDFKKYRTAEIHKMSIVRAMTNKDKWISVQVEERIVFNILNKFYDLFAEK